MTTQDEIRSYAADTIAIFIIVTVLYMATAMIPFPEYLNILVGAAVSYLFIKNSPNTV